MAVGNLRDLMVDDQRQQFFRASEMERLRDPSTEVFNLYKDSQVPVDLDHLRINYDGIEFRANDALKRYGREYVDQQTDPIGFFYDVTDNFICEEEKQMKKMRDIFHSRSRVGTRMGSPTTNYERYYRNIDQSKDYDNSHIERYSGLHVKPPGPYQAPPNYLDYLVGQLSAEGSLRWNKRESIFSDNYS
jgi:hypothetical protein